jgi:hypothetical protein
MSLLKADKDSNALSSTSSYGAEDSGDPAKCGYSAIEATGEAATSNADISSTKDSVGSDNEGTNMGSYSYQTASLNAKSGMKSSK